MDEPVHVPTFAEWLSHCFSDPIPAAPWDDCPNETVARFLVQLFEDPGAWANGLSDDRINKGLWFICGLDGWLRDAREPDVPTDLQVRWVRALKVLYRDLFAKRCTPDLQHLMRSGEPERGSPLNAICYMLWDMDQLEGAAMFPGGEHLVDPIFEVLTYALSLNSVPCQESALHGLGHLKRYHPERVEKIVDAFIANPKSLVPELAAYARAARAGRIR